MKSTSRRSATASGDRFGSCLLLGLLVLLRLLECFREEKFAQSLAAKQGHLLTVGGNLRGQHHGFQPRRHRDRLEDFRQVLFRQGRLSTGLAGRIFQILKIMESKLTLSHCLILKQSYPFLNVFLLLLLLLDDLALVDIEFVRVLQQLVNIIREAPQMLLENGPAITDNSQIKS